MFPVETINCPELELEKVVLPKLRGFVFHVTAVAGLKGIRKDKMIWNNRDAKFSFTMPPSISSYGRKRGYICLIDLRGITNEQLETTLIKYRFLNLESAENNPIFLFISESLFPELIPWTKARDEGAWDEVWVPRVEAWYPGNISIDNISCGISVHVKREPNPHQDMLEKNEKSLRG